MKIDDVARAMEDILAVAGPDETVANEAFEKLQKRVGLELGLVRPGPDERHDRGVHAFRT